MDGWIWSVYVERELRQVMNLCALEMCEQVICICVELVVMFHVLGHLPFLITVVAKFLLRLRLEEGIHVALGESNLSCYLHIVNNILLNRLKYSKTRVFFIF